MKSKYNPYTVPEGFFAEACAEAVVKVRRRRNALRGGLAAAVVTIGLLVPIFVQNARNQDATEQEVLADNLAKMYDYDIFIQVNF